MVARDWQGHAPFRAWTWAGFAVDGGGGEVVPEVDLRVEAAAFRDIAVSVHTLLVPAPLTLSVAKLMSLPLPEIGAPTTRPL